MIKKNYVPDWKLQRYLIGELPSDELETIRARSRGDDDLRSRIDALAACHAEIKAKYPPEWMARRVQLLAESRSNRANPSSAEARGGFPLLRVAIPAFACAALAVSIHIYMSPADTARGVFDDANLYGVRFKGGAGGVYEERVKGEEIDAPTLQVWRKAGNMPEKLAPDAEARAGDIVQLWYAVAEPCYGALVSVDGRGEFTVHLLGSDGKASELIPGRPVSLRTAYKLDDAPKYETFYLITSPDKFDLEPIKKIIMDAEHPIVDAQTLPLPQKHIAAFTLRKVSNRDI